MHRSRIQELSRKSGEVEGSYFYQFWEDYHSEPSKVHAFNKLEEILAQLDQDSWHFLLHEAVPLCNIHHKDRGWNQLFERLNEARGYVYLKSLGAKDIHFIPRSNVSGIETPDLEGVLAGKSILCEVKTLNVSTELLKAMEGNTVRNVSGYLNVGLRNKLTESFFKAASQLNSFMPGKSPHKILYLAANFDDSLDYADQLEKQTMDLFRTLNISGIELVVDYEI